MIKKVSIIGAGFSGLSAACYLSKAGFDVSVYEKNNQAGGRARTLNENGFLFDMGPSWYWMPDVFEKFYNDFGKTTSDFYELKRLNPSYSVFWDKHQIWDIPADYTALYHLFETVEKGSGSQLNRFLKESEFKYKQSMSRLIYKPALSPVEFLEWGILKSAFKIDLFKSFSSHIRKFFKHPQLIQLLEFPVLFLGAMPEQTPALYSLMNYADIKLGTWYPMGGMGKITEAMIKIAEKNGVKMHLNAAIDSIEINRTGFASGIKVNNASLAGDAILASADYHFVEQNLLSETHRTYNKSYWEGRVMAPSCLIFYLGVNKKIKKLNHHNLFFDADFTKHAEEIYKNPKWPTTPLFYVCCPSKTDASVAPEGYENLFILMPVAPGIKDTPEIREYYFNLLIERMELLTNDSFKNNIVYKKSYAHNNFIKDYNSFKGNAYGLSNTLKQTAFLKPAARSKKVKNLFYAGQLTVPGPGVPPAIISGKIASELIINYLK